MIPVNTTSSSTIHEEFFKAAKRYAEQVAFKAHGGKGRSYSYSEVVELVNHFAAGLHTEGFMKPNEVGLLSENCPEWCITYLSILAAGGTVVPIDTRLKLDEIYHIIRHAKLKTIIVSAALEQIISDFGNQLRII
ncbi:MAG: hypothetical protein DRP47_02415 [Candidatus Zixiibacteriota bacterium]|nr:MAG: hypothetical protein DRP47_02415 [candidate division Zixibacteria bacterium]